MSFALPLFLSNLLQIVYNMADMIIVGHKLGETGISAVSVGGDVSALMTFVAIGFANAGQVIIAKLIGAGQKHKISAFVGTMTGFLMLCAVIISTLALIFREEILWLMHTPSESWDGALEYSSICMAGLVFIYGYNIVSAVLRGMGDSKHPFIFIAIATVTNIILDIIFVIVLPYGAMGAALATVISQALSFVISIVFLCRHRSEFELDLKIGIFFKWSREMLSSLIKLGVPMAIKLAAVQISKLFVNSWINSYGVTVSAFAGIANKISSIANLISGAMNTAGSTMVGQNIAAGCFDRVKQILRCLAYTTLTVATVISAAILLFPDFIFRLFTSDAAVLAISPKYIPIAILLFYASAMRAIMNALINGSGNYKVNFATAIMDGIVLRIGLALLFGLALNMQHYGFWLGDALAGFTPFWIGVIFYFTGKWKQSVGERNARSQT